MVFAIPRHSLYKDPLTRTLHFQEGFPSQVTVTVEPPELTVAQALALCEVKIIEVKTPMSSNDAIMVNSRACLLV